MATLGTAEPGARAATTPVPYRVVSRVDETRDTSTLELEPLAEGVRPQPGQFAMLYAFGVGEVPISTSGDPARDGPLTHTIRRVGAVSTALASCDPGDVVGVRGPFGTCWPLAEAEGGDLLVVAGGIGLAPLRPAVMRALERREAYGAVSLLVGARTPEELLFGSQLEAWRVRDDLEVEVTVDAGVGGWRGRVGLVTKLLPLADVDPARTVALLCGPEVMMSLTARALLAQGLAAERIYVSLERNMRCATGHCGHCQLGPKLVCRDGAVFPFGEVAALMEVREL